MKKLQIIEPMQGGHHTNYLLALLPSIHKLLSAGALGQVVISVTASHMKLLSQGSGEYLNLAPQVEWDSTLPAVAPGPNLRDRSLLHYASLKSISAHRADGLLCTSADYDIVQNAVSNMIAAKLYWPKYSTGIVHYGYPKVQSRGKEHLKRLVYEAAWMTSRWHKLLMVNPLVYEDHLARGKAHPNRYDLLPDPVPAVVEMTRVEARQVLGISPAGTWVGCIGMMDRRKAIPELLDAFTSADLPANVRLLLAGRLDGSYARLLHEKYSGQVRDGKIVVLDRELTEVELHCGYHALDLHAILQYRRLNLSANVLKCVAVGRPFICDDIGFTAMIANRFSAGIVCDVNDIRSIQSALRNGLKNDGSVQTAAARELLRYHSIENFARVALGSVMGRPAHDVLGHAYKWTYPGACDAGLQTA